MCRLGAPQIWMASSGLQMEIRQVIRVDAGTRARATTRTGGDNTAWKTDWGLVGGACFHSHDQYRSCKFDYSPKNQLDWHLGRHDREVCKNAPSVRWWTPARWLSMPNTGMFVWGTWSPQPSSLPSRPSLESCDNHYQNHTIFLSWDPWLKHSCLLSGRPSSFWPEYLY